MDDRATAEIIAFPGRPVMPAPAVEPALAAPALAPDRLGTALSSLSAAMAEQREAVQKWRNAVQQLSAHMQSLNDTLDASKLRAAKKG